MRISLLIIIFSFQCLAASNTELQKELVSMAKADQEVRKNSYYRMEKRAY